MYFCTHTYTQVKIHQTDDTGRSLEIDLTLFRVHILYPKLHNTKILYLEMGISQVCG